jgi:hypothetical protein
MTDIRCRACHRLLGIGPVAVRIYCDTLCLNSVPADEFEDRDAVMEAVYVDSGKSKAEIGRMFGMTRQRADQILRRRVPH